MPLTAAQNTLLKTDIAANTNTVLVNDVPVAINALPNDSDSNDAIAKWYSVLASPDYWVWGANVSRVVIYNSVSPDGTSWDWTFFKNQSVTEQGAWREMFMGDSANFANLNLRAGIGKIFTAGSSVNRDHALAMGRRKCLRIGKLLATAVVGGAVANGNDMIAGNRGKASNPDLTGFEGQINYQDVEAARNS